LGVAALLMQVAGMVLRVPHYKSGEELAKMVSDAKARK